MLVEQPQHQPSRISETLSLKQGRFNPDFVLEHEPTLHKPFLMASELIADTGAQLFTQTDKLKRIPNGGDVMIEAVPGFGHATAVHTIGDKKLIFTQGRMIDIEEDTFFDDSVHVSTQQKGLKGRKSEPSHLFSITSANTVISPEGIEVAEEDKRKVTSLLRTLFLETKSAKADSTTNGHEAHTHDRGPLVLGPAHKYLGSIESIADYEARMARDQAIQKGRENAKALERKINTGLLKKRNAERKTIFDQTALL